MRGKCLVAAAASGFYLASAGPLLAQSVEAKIAEALLAAPEALRGGATVIVQDVMDWITRRLAEGARSFQELFAGGGPDADVSPGAMQYALVGPTREEAELRVSINLPHATGASTGLPTEERTDGPWLMWAGTSAAHIMFGEIPPGIPAEYPGR